MRRQEGAGEELLGAQQQKLDEAAQVVHAANIDFSFTLLALITSDCG